MKNSGFSPAQTYRKYNWVLFVPNLIHKQLLEHSINTINCFYNYFIGMFGLALKRFKMIHYLINKHWQS